MIKLKVRFLNSILQKSVGLIGQSNPKPVFFKTRFGIHTFGVKFPIDVLILDKENRVVVLKKKLKPNRMWWWNTKFDKVVELPNGTIEAKKIKIGSEIELCR